MNFDSKIREKESVSELQKEIRRCKEIVNTLQEKAMEQQSEIDPQTYQRLNEAFKQILQKTSHIPEQLLYPTNPEFIRYLGCSVSLQASQFNNLVEISDPNKLNIDDQLILEKKKQLDSLYQWAKQHRYFLNK